MPQVINPFQEFNHYEVPRGPDGTPYETYESLRDFCAEQDKWVHWSEAFGGYWVCCGYDEARQIQHNTEAFSNSAVTFPSYGTPGDGDAGRPIMLSEYDEPLHKRYRKLVQEPFSPKTVGRVAESLRASTNDLIDSFIDAGRVNIIEAIANEVPARLTALLMGLPPEEGDKYRRWTHAMAQEVHTDPAGAAKNVQELQEYFAEFLRQRRAQPGEDVMSLVIESEVDDERLTDAELEDFFVVLLLGGIDNTNKFLGTFFWRLSWDKELRRRLVHDPSILATATDEFLRLYGPSVAGRLVTQEITVGGAEMKPGQHVLMVHPIANRDPREFPHPDVLILDRSPNRHLGLGLGIHRCLGAHILRVEARVVAEEFFRRIPEFEPFASESPVEWTQGQVSGIDDLEIVYPRGGGYSRTPLSAPTLQPIG